MGTRDIYRGCMVGGAAGDALGYPVEFMSEDEIFDKYGKQGIIEYELCDGKALISDDTQMSLFTANGILLGITRASTRGVGGEPPGYIQRAYWNWYETQTQNYYDYSKESRYTWLVNLPEMWQRRAPGKTCLKALKISKQQDVLHADNRSKGCGGVMRVAPVGLYFAKYNVDISEIARIASETAAITHGHELGQIPAAMLACIIATILRRPKLNLGEVIQSSLRAMEKIYSSSKYWSYFCELLVKAFKMALLNKDINDVDAIHEIGQGWVAEETLAIAIYCALKYSDSFEKAVVAAVNHRGDSDSTGAVTGNIMGAYLGYKAIPQKFKDNLELIDVCLEIADDMYDDCQVDGYENSSRVMGKKRIWMLKYDHPYIYDRVTFK